MRALLVHIMNSNSPVKCGIHKVIVFLVKFVKRLAKRFSEALIVNDLALAKIAHHIIDIRIIR